MTRFVEVAHCACPIELAPAVLQVIHVTGSAPLSLYRGQDPGAVTILHRNGKATQADLVADPRRFGVLGTPNAVGTSTHELRSDGRAFPGPVGRRLDPVQCGQDWPDADVPRVLAVYRRLGCAPIQPYAGGFERHHLCCTLPPRRGVDPLVVLRALPLQPGDRSPFVRPLLTYLRRGEFISRAASASPAAAQATYTAAAVAAVQRFQRRVGLPHDGIVGPRTFAALRRRYGWRVWRR